MSNEQPSHFSAYPKYRFIHLDDNGNIIILFVAAPISAQDIADIEKCAHSAGLGGTVVPVWRLTTGQFAYDAPDQWRNLLDTMDWEHATSRVFGELTCYPEPSAWRLEPSHSEPSPPEPEHPTP